MDICIIMQLYMILMQVVCMLTKKTYGYLTYKSYIKSVISCSLGCMLYKE